MADENKALTGLNRLRGNLKEAADKYRALRRIKVNVPNGCGAEITATKDGQTVKGTEKNGVAYIDIPSYGLWTLTGKTVDGTGDPVTVDVKNTQQYEVSMRFKVKISKEVSVRYPDYITDAYSYVDVRGKGEHSDYRDNPSGTLENGAVVVKFVPPDMGEYTVTPYAHINNMYTPGEVINLTVTENVEQSFDAKFAGFRVSTKIGAKLTIKPHAGMTRIEDVTMDNELFIVSLEGGPGTFTLSSTIDGSSAQTVTKEVTLNGFEVVDVSLPFDTAPPPPPEPPKPSYKIYGVRVDETNENPDTRVVYTDDAIGMQPGWENWKNEYMFSQIRPCILKDGKVVKYLQQDNRTLYEDGTPAVLDDPSVGDVMIEFPQHIGWKFTKTKKGYHMQVTNKENEPGFVYYAFDWGRNRFTKLYISAYLMCSESGVPYSLANKNPDLSGVPRGDLQYSKNDASAVFDGNWATYSFHTHTLLQCLFLLMYKTTNGQSALGTGGRYTGGSYAADSTVKPTGATNTVPFCGSEPVGGHVVFLGIEHFWTIGCGVDLAGLATNSGSVAVSINSPIYKGPEGLESDFKAEVSTVCDDYGTHMLATDWAPFIATAGGGSATTGYCDWQGIKKSVTALNVYVAGGGYPPNKEYMMADLIGPFTIGNPDGGRNISSGIPYRLTYHIMPE